MKRFIGRAINRGLRHLGYELVKDTHVTLGSKAAQEGMAVHLRELFSAWGITCVFDIGANKGQYYEFLRNKVDYEGHIVSFEPIPELAQDLERRSKSDPFWKVFNCAIGGSTQTLPFKVMSRSGWSSLRDKEDVSKTEVADGFTVERIVPVSVRTLDEVRQSLPQSQNGGLFLKIDAQGYDLEVLQGATNTLPALSGLQTELELITVYAGASGYMAVLKFLQDRSYEMTGVFPLWFDKKTFRIGEMDTVFCNMKRVR